MFVFSTLPRACFHISAISSHRSIVFFLNVNISFARSHIDEDGRGTNNGSMTSLRSQMDTLLPHAHNELRPLLPVESTAAAQVLLTALVNGNAGRVRSLLPTVNTDAFQRLRASEAALAPVCMVREDQPLAAEHQQAVEHILEVYGLSSTRLGLTWQAFRAKVIQWLQSTIPGMQRATS